MDAPQLLLILTALLCTLVTGYILTFSIVVMPGLSALDDRAYLTAFQHADRVIQDGQPIFALTWLGSIFSLVGVAAISVVDVGFVESRALLALCMAYLFGVQAITGLIHIPMNNRVQRLAIEDLSDLALQKERQLFEGKWVRYNNARTAVALCVSVGLLILIGYR